MCTLWAGGNMVSVSHGHGFLNSVYIYKEYVYFSNLRWILGLAVSTKIWSAKLLNIYPGC